MVTGCSGESSPVLNTEYNINSTECGVIAPESSFTIVKVNTAVTPNTLTFGKSSGGSDDGTTADKRHQALDTDMVLEKI